MLVARRVYWAALQAGLAPGRTGLVAHWFGLVAGWFGLVACFRGFGRVWLVAIFGWGLSSGVV